MFILLVFFVFHTKMAFVVSHEDELIEKDINFLSYLTIIFGHSIEYSREFGALRFSFFFEFLSLLIAGICQAARKTQLVMGRCRSSGIPN